VTGSILETGKPLRDIITVMGLMTEWHTCPDSTNAC
jgi:hypothetical protein